MDRLDKIVVHAEPTAAKSVSPPYFCENSAIVGAAGVPVTRMTVASSGKGNLNMINGKRNSGMPISLIPVTIHKSLSFQSLYTFAKLIFAISAPINNIDSGIVVEPTEYKTSDKMYGNWNGRINRTIPARVATIPGFKKIIFQGIPSFFPTNK